MFKTKIKAFFKYREYRRFLIRRFVAKLKPVTIVKLIMMIIFLSIFFNARILSQIKEINQSSVRKIFALEELIFPKNQLNKTAENNDNNISQKDKTNVSMKGEQKKESGIDIVSKDEYQKVMNKIKQLEIENEKLKDDNVSLQNLLRLAASRGTKPRNYRIAPPVVSRSGTLRGEYIGKFTVTSYTPSKEECGSDKGITYSGHPIVPGVSVAVDKKYWPIGTVFYIKGLGYVVAMDTGSAVKGRNRIDFAVLDRNFAKKIGRRQLDVYLIKLGNGKVEDINF